MKPTTLARNGFSAEMVELIGRLIDLIAWPARRRAMGDVTMALLDGKRHVAEDVFGWNRKAVSWASMNIKLASPASMTSAPEANRKQKTKTPSCWLK
jgi:hypothetical protein